MKPSDKRPFLIGGIDVGLHTSIALLDLAGNIIYLDTLIHPQNCDILDRMTKMGNVLVLSTDRAKPPSHAKKIAASISAKMVLPAKNMTKKKKRLLVEDFIKKGRAEAKKRMNDHEKAALASAIFAYRRFRPGFKKLRDRMEKKRQLHTFDDARKELFMKMIRDI